MKKTSKLGCLLIALALSLPCFAKRPIKWEGRWETREKSIFQGLPIQAWIEDDNKSLLLEFSENLGTVLISVTNGSGEVVYNQAIQASQTSPTIISLNEEMKEGCVLSVTDGINKVSGYINY